MSKTTTKLTVALAAALLASGAAMAQGLTRADVVADLQAARDSGELAAMTAEKGTEGLGNAKAAAVKNVVVKASKPVPVAAVAAPAAAVAEAAPAAAKTRAQVIAELAAAQADGSLVASRINSELGFTPAAVKVAPATMLAGQPKTNQQ